jgi:hypothetical protein
MMSADALKVQKNLESKYTSETAEIDDVAKKLYSENVWKAREYLTAYSIKSAQDTFDQWKKLSEYLIVKYIDGNIKKEKDGKFERSADGCPVMPLQPGYSDKWKKSVIQDTGNKLLVQTTTGH